MLGNVQEYIDEPFQMTGPYGLSAQRGGSTLRGGSYLTSYEHFSNSLRTEKKRYTDNKPTRPRDTGMRMMLNVSVTLDPKNLKKLESDVVNVLSANGFYKEKTNAVKPNPFKKDPIEMTTLQPQKDKVYENTDTPDGAGTVEKTVVLAGKSAVVAQNDKVLESVTVNPEEKNALKPEEASAYIGKFKRICGRVEQSSAYDSYGYLNFGGKYPNHKFSVFITKIKSYPDLEELKTHRVCVEGTLEIYRGKPQISNPLSLEIIN